MSFQRPTLSEITNRVLADFALHANEGKPLSPRTLPCVLAHAIAGLSHMLHGHLDFISKQIFPHTCSLENLEVMASLRGIERRSATCAKGSIRLQGRAGTVIPKHTELSRSDGVLFQTTEAKRISRQGFCEILSQCQTEGALGNTASQTPIRLMAPIAGVEQALILHMQGGWDAESQEDLLARYLIKLRNPFRGGSQSDYENLALEVPGVHKVWVYENTPVLGKVGITLIMKRLEAPLPTDLELEEVKTHLDQKKPLLAKLHVFRCEPYPVTFQMRLHPKPQEVKDRIEKALKHLLFQEGKPQGKMLHSHILKVISKSITNQDFALESPTGDIQVSSGCFPLFESIDWMD